jgi:Protein of unknown function (DUF3341)
MTEHGPDIYGVMGEFLTPEEILHAATQARQAGFQYISAYTPFPVEGLAHAIGFPRTGVPLLALTGGLLGCLGGFGMQYWCSAIAYPLNIGGRPLNSWPAFIPVTFELTILGAATFAVVGMLALNLLPQPYHPVFNVERFARATTDRFFLCIESRDPQFQLAKTARFLQSVHAHHVHEVSNAE